MTATPTPQESWNQRYADTDLVWSGKPHPLLVELVAGLRPGRSLDIGCGEGADTLWLAQRGWQSMGIDFSDVAIDRAAQKAVELGLYQATFAAVDIEEYQPSNPFDLVSAFFFHPRDYDARSRFLRAAASWVAPGGHLLVVSHADRKEGSKQGPPPITPGADARALDAHGPWKYIEYSFYQRQAPGGTRRDAVVFAKKTQIRTT